jgi:3',5'-cyclic AMP phosphodiesterase CpdA
MPSLRLAQISDFHFTKLTWNPLRLFSKRLLGNLNWVLARKKTFSSLHLDALPAYLKTLQLDRILLAGDFTTTSLVSEFEWAQTLVQQLDAPWIAVPGNHDRYTFSACRKKLFYQYFNNLHPKCGRFNLKEHGVEAHNLAEGWHLIALDTARATQFYDSSGLFSKQQEKTLQEVLAAIPQNEKILLLNHYPFFQNDTPQRSLVRGKALEAIVQKDSRIKAYLHGHTHRHTIANLQPSGLPVILDGGCVANIEKGSWNLLSLDDRGVTIDVMKWQHGWTVARQERIEWTR